MNKIYLLLGSNMGNSREQLVLAHELIEKKIGAITRQSKLYVTAAWGNTQQREFLNQVLVVASEFSAQQTMNSILQIEQQMGRVRTVRNAPRIIDIDILFFNKEIIQEKNLMVPHPEIQNRRFVLVPLNELSPGFQHPVLKINIHSLLNNCADTLDVKKF